MRSATVDNVSDLFSSAAEDRLRAQAPLAARLRPRTLDDVVGQAHLVGPNKPLRRLVEQDRLTSALFWGPPGTGKTTLALAVAGTTKRAFEQLSAVAAGVKDVREVIERARHRLGEHGRGTILFLDEIHRFSKAQQDALLPAVEDGTLTLIGATTENPFFEVNAPLRSRSTLFRLEPLGRADIEILIQRGLEAEGRTATAEAVTYLADRAGGDGRQVLTALEVAVALAHPGDVQLPHVESALGTSALRYGRDDHYDVVSAFIKSMRGSDAQATVYYLARMRSNTSACPRRSSTSAKRPSIWPPHPRATGRPWPSGTRAPTCRPAQWGRCLHTCATRTTKVRRASGTGWATTTLMITPRGTWRSSTCQPNRSTSATTSRRITVPRPQWPSAWRSDSRWTATDDRR